MLITCKNCNQTYKGHFCNNCGQSAETHKLDVHFLWHDIQHGLLHFDKGILYSAKKLFTEPGITIREYIEGKRIHHFKPISLVIVLATVYGLLCHLFDIHLIVSENNIEKANHYNEWSTSHFAWITLITIPFYTIGTFVFFRKQGYNFIEFLIQNTFKASQRLFLHILLFPVIYYFNDTPQINKVRLILYLIDVALIFWTNLQFFDKLSKPKVILTSILSHLLFLVLFTTFTAIIMYFLGLLNI